PHIAIERPELLLHGEKGARIRDRGLDLLAIADDARVIQQARDAAPVESRDRLGIEARERSAVALALAQDRDPGEACLCGLEHQELEQLAVVVQRHSPFAVVVFDVDWLGPDPVASLHVFSPRNAATARATSRVTLSSA